MGKNARTIRTVRTALVALGIAASLTVGGGASVQAQEAQGSPLQPVFETPLTARCGPIGQVQQAVFDALPFTLFGEPDPRTRC